MSSRAVIFKIVYEDRYLIVIEKNVGILSTWLGSCYPERKERIG